VRETADAVFGSRFAGGEARRVLLFRHQLGNKLLTFLTNLATNLNLTDMETCYKAVRTDLLRSIPIVSHDFRLEPELTIKLAKREARIFEIPISYSGRTYQEGKKIGWRDGVKALLAILRFSLGDDVYVRDEHGSQMLGRLARAERFNSWMADVIRPFLGARLLEIGSGTGNLTRRLVPRDVYVASDVNPLYVKTLENLTSDRPYLAARFTDVTDLATYPQLAGGFDSVVCLNVIEHVDDDVGALRNIRAALAENGKAVVLVPNGPWNFGSLDEVLGHKRRYTEASLRKAAEAAGLRVTQVVRFNRVSSLPWFLNGRILGKKSFGLLQIRIVDWITPISRVLDRFLPFPPLSLIAVMERRPE
jgi:SAM-dependent methyltransferase